MCLEASLEVKNSPTSWPPINALSRAVFVLKSSFLTGVHFWTLFFQLRFGSFETALTAAAPAIGVAIELNLEFLCTLLKCWYSNYCFGLGPLNVRIEIY